MFYRLDMKFVSSHAGPQDQTIMAAAGEDQGILFRGRSALEQEIMNTAAELLLADEPQQTEPKAHQHPRLSCFLGFALCGQYICILNLVVSSFKENMIVSKREQRLDQNSESFRNTFLEVLQKRLFWGITQASANSVAEQ